MKNLKMRSAIMTIIAITTFIGIGLLFALASSNSMKMIKSRSVDGMDTYLVAQTNSIESFVEESENKLLLFSKSDAVKNLLLNQSDEAAFNTAQQYTLDYYGTLNAWEGLYIGNWDTTVLTYNVPQVIGKTMREGERLEQLRNAMMDAVKNGNGVYDTGIIVSPGSGQLCLSMYAAVLDDNGNPIGYVGGGVFNTALENKLMETTVSGLLDTNFYMINTESDLTYIGTDEQTAQEIAQPVSNPMLQEVMARVNAGTPEDILYYTYENGSEVIVDFKSVSDRGWTLALAASKDEMYKAAYDNSKSMLSICIIAYVIIVGASFISVSIRTKPLSVAEKAIVRIGSLDLGEEEGIRKLTNRKDEIGILSREIENLRHSLTDIVQTLSGCSDDIDDTATMMSDSSDSLAENVTVNTTITRELACSMDDTNSTVIKLYEDVKNINGMLKSVEGAISSGNEKSEELLNNATDMQKAASEALEESAQSISNNRNEISRTVEKLNKLSEINSLVSDILVISSQTNLLSLNASIEAARAGEMGRGFAVVAGEIGNLAASSSTTAANIQNICSSTNDNIAEVSKCFETIIDYLESDVEIKFEKFNEVAQVNDEISSDIKQIMTEVRSSMSEFIKFVNDIAVQMDAIKAVSDQNNAGITEIVEKNNQSNMIAEEMMDVVTRNKESVEQLKEIVSRFTYN